MHTQIFVSLEVRHFFDYKLLSCSRLGGVDMGVSLGWLFGLFCVFNAAVISVIFVMARGLLHCGTRSI